MEIRSIRPLDMVVLSVDHSGSQTDARSRAALRTLFPGPVSPSYYQVASVV